MAEKQFYAAIDLGTTNSVIAYGNITRNKMKPIVLELDRKNDTGSTSRSPLLPSVVFYYRNAKGEMATDVGDYAKSRYGTRVGYVCKSVKSLMGVTDQVPLAGEIPDKTPADVSGQILSYMVSAAKKRLFQQELRDVVITVPASFDSDQCQATIDAARKAGINVENRHDILLYEPKAVIYDFMRMQEDGEIPPDLLSLESEKNVLVFDLGGGTLDVTLHRVAYSEEGILDIRDLAISRYTLLGGDNFDELLAIDMLKRFEEMNGIKVSIRRREEVMCKLRKLAEQLKMNLSTAYQSAQQMSEMELPDDYEIEEVMDVNLYDAYAFASVYTKAEVEEILAPLMGYSYQKSDVSRIQRMDEKDVDNIIYPVLDVLDKAGKGVNIDAVILNGGMTKFYLIRKRLREFFGFEPLETADPDLAVARGAVYYHYCLHKYGIQNSGETMERDADKKETPKGTFRTGTILNDSINLGLRGGYVSLLIPAGTELPYRSEEIRDRYKLDKATNSIGIELFLGRGKTKNLPNRRIATRVVKFKNTFPADTPISFQIYINSLRMMTMEAWITDRPGTKTTMEMDMTSLKNSGKAENGIRTNERMILNAKSEMNELKNLVERNKTRPGYDLNDQIARVLEAIGQASNPQDFFPICMEMARKCFQSDVMRAYIYTIGISFKDGWSDSQKRQILSVAKKHFTNEARSVSQSNYVIRKAMELIAVMDPEFVKFYTNYLEKMEWGNPKRRQVMLQYVALYEKDDDRVAKFYERFFEQPELNKWILNALIQRYGRGTPGRNRRKLSRLARKLVKGLDASGQEKNVDQVIVLIAELCSGEEESALPTAAREAAWTTVERCLAQRAVPLFSSAVLHIWEEEELSQEESKVIQEIVWR